nr:MAG TPA: hypothetical protein [Caudoviricetes sp.]
MAVQVRPPLSEYLLIWQPERRPRPGGQPRTYGGHG